MAYRRPGRKTWSFDGKTRHGYEQINTGVRDKSLANKLQAMWADLAGNWAWDLLEKVPLEELYEKYEASRHHLHTLRQSFVPQPVEHDVAAMVATWLPIYQSSHTSERADRVLHDVRWLLPEGVPRAASTVTSAWLEERLSNYRGSLATRRRVHSSWSVFFEWCRKNGIFPHSPMRDVEVPQSVVPPPKFYELDEVIQIVEEQPTPERVAFMAFMYGTGADVSPAVEVRRRDFDDGQRQVRIMGTKATGRDRIASIQPWAWPYIKPHLKTLKPADLAFDFNRWTSSDWHRETVEALRKQKKIHAEYPLRNCRHHLAVLLVRTGWPLQAVADQLGNSVLMVTRHYARFRPTASERALWQKKTDSMIAQRFPRAYTPASSET